MLELGEANEQVAKYTLALGCQHEVAKIRLIMKKISRER